MSHKSFALFGLGQSYIQIFEKRNQLEYHYFVLTQQQQQQQQQKQQKKKEQIFICRAPLILFLKIFFHLMFYGRSSILVPICLNVRAYLIKAGHPYVLNKNWHMSIKFG